MPVRLTVPFKVIRLAASIAPAWFAASWNALLPNAGLDVLNSAIRVSPLQCESDFLNISKGEIATSIAILNPTGNRAPGGRIPTAAGVQDRGVFNRLARA